MHGGTLIAAVCGTLIALGCGGGARGTGPHGPPPPPGPETHAEPGSTGRPLDCQARPGGPTRAQCVAVVDHLNRVMPDDMSPDRESDVCECLAMPRGFIECLEGVTSAAEADECVEAVPARRAGSAGPTRAECERTVAHLKRIDPQFASETREEDVIDACVDEATRTEIDCLNAATTRAEVEKCDSGR